MSQPSLPADVSEWLAAFVETHGRAPRILHVGNIANNAYNNAKMLNAAGFDCDVICYDYYHIMGCPEWEDADFRGAIADQFKPDFTRVDLQGFRRPRWFAQGPVDWAIRYLVARREGRSGAARLWWGGLAVRRWTHTRRNRAGIGFARSLVRGLRRAVATARSLPRRVARPIRRGLRPWTPSPVRRVIRAILVRPNRFASAPGLPRQEPATPFDRRVTALIAEFDARFPDRPDRLTAADVEPYRGAIETWRDLFEMYDVVEGYSTDPILPMVAGTRPYIAYEHGTIREIPFEATAVGRLTALAYVLADAVVITNPDCGQAADRLGIRTRRAIPHLIDHKYYDAALGAGGPLPGGVRAPYVFCPARHDWEVKGTNILIEAFARVRVDRPDVQLVMASWGGDLEKSMALARSLGIEDGVAFVPPLHIHDLIRVARRAEAIVDQFRYGVFGGIGPTALAVGTPLVTHLDHSKSAWCMEEAPYFQAHDVESCERALKTALTAKTPEMAAALRAWMERNYWYGFVASRHAELFMDALGSARPALPLATIEPLPRDEALRYETQST